MLNKHELFILNEAIATLDTVIKKDTCIIYSTKKEEREYYEKLTKRALNLLNKMKENQRIKNDCN